MLIFTRNIFLNDPVSSVLRRDTFYSLNLSGLFGPFLSFTRFYFYHAWVHLCLHVGMCTCLYSPLETRDVEVLGAEVTSHRVRGLGTQFGSSEGAVCAHHH